MIRFLVPALILLSGCAGTNDFPSLNPRPIEREAGRLLDESPRPKAAPAPSDPARAAQIAALIDTVMASAPAFDEAYARAEALTARAGPRESESWIAAQMALSALERTRGPVRQALGDLDALRQRVVQGPSSEDRDRLDAAIQTVEALDGRQYEAYAELLQQLSR